MGQKKFEFTESLFSCPSYKDRQTHPVRFSAATTLDSFLHLTISSPAGRSFLTTDPTRVQQQPLLTRKKRDYIEISLALAIRTSFNLLIESSSLLNNISSTQDEQTFNRNCIKESSVCLGKRPSWHSSHKYSLSAFSISRYSVIYR
jgi:hypothetical protein